MPTELYAKLREHKREVWHWLRILFEVKDALGGVRTTQQSQAAESVCNMALETFRLAGLAIEVKSDLLDEVIILGSDNAVVVSSERRPIYRARELLEIWAVVGPDELRGLHAAKKRAARLSKYARQA